MKPDWYCKLFIRAEMPEEELLELDLIRIDEYVPGSQDFLFWRYYADLDAVTEEWAAYVRCIRELMAFLQERQIETVAACDFEQELV